MTRTPASPTSLQGRPARSPAQPRTAEVSLFQQHRPSATAQKPALQARLCFRTSWAAGNLGLCWPSVESGLGTCMFQDTRCFRRRVRGPHLEKCSRREKALSPHRKDRLCQEITGPSRPQGRGCGRTERGAAGAIRAGLQREEGDIRAGSQSPSRSF